MSGVVPSTQFPRILLNSVSHADIACDPFCDVREHSRLCAKREGSDRMKETSQIVIRMNYFENLAVLVGGNLAFSFKNSM